MTGNRQQKSKERVNDHGEVFTAEREVNAMLDLVKQETERIDSRFLEPACGTGNFLVEILQRKLKIVRKRYKRSQLDYETYAVVAIASIYGVDLLEDNVEECQRRLFDIFDEQYTELYGNKCKKACRASVKFILDLNIIKGDALSLKTVDNGEPIVFSEWAVVAHGMIKRRDYTFKVLLPKDMPEPDDELSLFPDFVGDLDNDARRTRLTSDTGKDVFIPEPVKKFPLTHFLRLAEYV